MKITTLLLAMTAAMTSQLSIAQADSGFLTAYIDREGRVLRQSPLWIETVSYKNQLGYFANYTIKPIAGTFAQDPAFCTVSPTDNSTVEKLYYGYAKLSAAPTAGKISVVGLSVGGDGPVGDASGEFMLACSR